MRRSLIALILVAGFAHSASGFEKSDDDTFEALTSSSNFTTAVSVYKDYSAKYNPGNSFDVFPRVAYYSGNLSDLMDAGAQELIADECGAVIIINTFELYPAGLTADGLARIYRSEQREVSSRADSRYVYITSTIDVNAEGDEVVVKKQEYRSLLKPKINGTKISVYDKTQSKLVDSFAYNFKLTSEFRNLGHLINSFRSGIEHLDINVVDLSSPSAYNREVSRIEKFEAKDITLWKVKSIFYDSKDSMVKSAVYHTVYGKDGTRIAQERQAGDHILVMFLDTLEQDEELLCKE